MIPTSLLVAMQLTQPDQASVNKPRHTNDAERSQQPQSQLAPISFARLRRYCRAKPANNFPAIYWA
jgi:hypothetical protein